MAIFLLLLYNDAELLVKVGMFAMSYVTVICPYCRRELFMPEDAKDVVCMYCAKPIDIAELLRRSLKHQAPAAPEQAEKLLNEARAALPQKLVGGVHDYGKFSVFTYEKNFPEYESALYKSLSLASDAFLEDRSSADKFADILLKAVEDQMVTLSATKEGSRAMFDVQYFMVTFFIPAILNFKSEASGPIADCFIEKWNAKHTKSGIKKSTFEDIKQGFRFKNKWCFITTATCNTLGKPDNCYELNMFRSFRDRYSETSDENRKKVLYYYRVAPFIVSKIEGNSDKDLIYREIWETYLSKCLTLLASGDDAGCANLYAQMMQELLKEFSQ